MFDLFTTYFDNAEWSGEWNSFLLVIIAGVLGGIVGIERELKDKPAGLRTHMLVAASAALLVMLGRVIVEDFTRTQPANSISADPTRVLHAIVIGISFLGAGTIIKQGEQIEGLTTSSSVLLVTGIGVAVALEKFLLAVLLSVTAVIILQVFGLVERRFAGRMKSNERHQRSPRDRNSGGGGDADDHEDGGAGAAERSS